MRWKTRIIEEGEIRIINRFLILPTFIYYNGFWNNRWLEWAKIKQKRVYDQFDGYYWANVEFVD